MTHLSAVGPEVDAPELIRQALHKCDVEIGGGRPWDLHIHQPNVYKAALQGNFTELCEAYVRGEWDCDRIDQLVARLTQLTDVPHPNVIHWLGELLSTSLKDGGSRRGAKKVAREHYDLGNDLFEAMLDSTMTYSCGYWKSAKNLEEAQTAKLDLICRKLKLEKGMRFLDVGGCWGGLAIHAARHYGVEAVMITVSQNQQEEAQRRAMGLPIEVRLQDYRDATGTYDAIASVGMFEHVGAHHYRPYMVKMNELLRPNGLFLLHCIGSFSASHGVNPWIDREIFPGGHIPAAVEVTQAIESLWIMEDWHNFGSDYDKTLMVWNDNFDQAWERLKFRYSEAFRRQWRLYLLGCAGSFRARQLQLWQIVLSPSGVPDGYESVR